MNECVCGGGHQGCDRLSGGCISPEALDELQEIFEETWQEMNALAKDDGRKDASALRRELAEAILTYRYLDDPAEVRNGGAKGRYLQ